MRGGNALAFDFDRKGINFSSDFYDHATMYLISELFHNNNSDKFEIFAYSYGRNNTGIWHDRAKQYVNHFFDVSDKSDRCLAAR